MVNYFQPRLQHLRKEVFKAVLLNTKHQVLKDVTVSEGSLSASLVHPREAFLPAIKESAAAVIFLHNHPSGDPTPSTEDKELTIKLGAREVNWRGMQYLLGFALPNFYFHAATAYDILRHNGVELAKRDFIGTV